jgi:hypothetical protein
VPCAAVGTYLGEQLKIPTSRRIVVMVIRGDAVSEDDRRRVVDVIRGAGFNEVEIRETRIAQVRPQAETARLT